MTTTAAHFKAITVALAKLVAIPGALKDGGQVIAHLVQRCSVPEVEVTCLKSQWE